MNKKILLVDDDIQVLKSLNNLLKKEGYEVISTNNSLEAIEIAKKESFDLLIFDIRMPDLDGLSTLETIRKLNTKPNTLSPVIIITGYAGESEVSKKAAELGITDLIYKPFEIEEFLKIVKKNIQQTITPKELILDYSIIDAQFIKIVEELENYLINIKNKFDEYDKNNTNEEQQVEFVRKNKKEIFDKLDNYFDKMWDYLKNLNKEKYIIYQKFCQKKFWQLIINAGEINKHEYQKPFGYPGDFVMMNYIYDYNGDTKFLGNSSYEKLINNYTCNIPISCSNIIRKEFLKRKIVETLKEKKHPKILSIACGSARELIELLKENKINQPLSFCCLDFEKRAIDYIISQIETIQSDKKTNLSIEYICRDITSIIRDKQLKKNLAGKDLVYAAGLFDYLSDRMAERLTKELYDLLNEEGELIICNISLEKYSHRAYYELLGEWYMIYRTKEEMLNWTKNLNGNFDVKFEENSQQNKYWFLSIKKKKN